MIYKRKRIVVALGGNALGNTLPEQMIAVKSTAKALCDLIEEGHQVVVVHGNGPQVGMINNAMTALTHEDQAQPNTPLSVCVAMSQAYIGYDLRQHRSSGKLAFFNVFSGLGNGKIVQPFLIFFAKINGNFFHSSQNDQHICIQLLCKQAACEIFVNDSRGTF